MAQSVERPIPEFCSGHDLLVQGTEPCIGLYAESTEPAWDSLSPSLSAPPPQMHFLSLSLLLNVYLFILRERQREDTSGGGAEREGERESQAGSVPSAQSSTRGSIP